MNILSLPLTDKTRHTVVGGPYRDVVFQDTFKGFFKVCMAFELQDRPANLRVPVKDFRVPSTKQINEALPVLVSTILKGKPVVIGCMGGVGRTGLMLAILAKAFGVKAPIHYVRAYYNEHAVETLDQENFVEGYKIPTSVRLSILLAKGRAFFGNKRGNLTVSA